MKRPQLITATLAIILVIALYAATEKQIFGPTSIKPQELQNPVASASSLSIDSLIRQAEKKIPPEVATRLELLQQSITRGDIKNQKIQIFDHLARFWGDTARQFAPYAWYTSEKARLENSEKSLTFAARLFLDNLTSEEKPDLKNWEAIQAKDLYERSLKLNPNNDSSKVGLGAVYLYGGIEMPMKGIGMIKEVADKDSSNIYAQMTLGQASLASRQFDKALERFKTINRLQPANLEAILLLGEVYEQMEKKPEAIEWYNKSLPLIQISGLKKEVEARIAELRK